MEDGAVFGSDGPVIFSLEEIEEATSYFDETKKIGEGGYGSVFFGVIRKKEVAIKKMRSNSTKEFSAELKVLCKIHHINVLSDRSFLNKLTSNMVRKKVTCLLKIFVEKRVKSLLLLQMAEIAKWCLSEEAVERPEMREIVVMLSQIATSSIEWEATLGGNSQVFGGVFNFSGR